MKDLTSATWIKVKGILFLLLGLGAAMLLLLENPTWNVALLLALAIWCFCRFYYFRILRHREIRVAAGTKPERTPEQKWKLFPPRWTTTGAVLHWPGA